MLLLVLLLLSWWLLCWVRWLLLLPVKEDAKSDSTDKAPAAAAPLTIRGAVATGTVLAVVDAGELVSAVEESRSDESSDDAIENTRR